ncbi:MAG: carbohydrate binding family 9 domain-containing protein [Candidatus Latescibacteria bacterium]|nr:carbohydrate binding family 9 domain-containing protein [Candidatus Latescibacterota bacterium]
MISLSVLSLPSLLLAQATGTARPHPERTITAARVNPGSPKIDGVLDDEVWQHAPVSGGFTQVEPIEGAAPTESTTVQVVYDDEAIYVGITLYDHEPDKITARLARRDQWAEADLVNVYFDPYLDHQTGYLFAINAAGSLQDSYLYNDTWRDGTWDGVWEARATIHERGWSAEYKIPYHILRFSPKDDYVWGFQVTRYMSRKQEWTQWVLKRRSDNGWVSRFGHLEGIRGIKPPTSLEVLPYTVARSTFRPAPKSVTDPKGREFFSNLGGDLRYGITSNVSLNATFNPDFGQVDADPAVLNLSVFETFFEERRPFFVEGGQTFRTPFQLFYSRRIGRRPGYLSTPSGSSTIERPDNTTILSAAKITGKTAHKTTFGMLDAITSSEDATILQNGVRQTARIEPLTNYWVGRVQQDILSGNSTVGLLMTAVNRKDAASAYTGGVDWNLKWHNNTYAASGQIAGSQVGHLTYQRGYASQARFSKQGGWLLGEVYFDALSPGFNANDLGFIRRVNRMNTSAWLGMQKTRPWGPFLRNQFNVNKWDSWNYARVHLQDELNFNTWHQLKSFWWMGGGLTRRFESLDDLDTRGGPPIVNPAGVSFFAEIESNYSKPISGWIFTNLSSDAGGSRYRSIGPGLTIRPSARIELRIRPNYSWNFDNAQWVTNVQSGGQTHYVYGELNSKVLDFTTRADVLFTRDISLQLYLQPFVAVGDYKNFKELARPSSYEFTPYSGLDFNPDFNSRSLRSNLVFRWEYRPGSTLFLVWSQSRSAFSNDPTFRFQNLGRSFKDDGPNVFMLKVNYFLNN